MDISNSTILVAGGSSGLGAACRQRLVELGANVVVADVKPPADVTGSTCLFAEADVTSEPSVRSALASTVGRFGHLHGVVICAGVIHAQRIVGRHGPFDLDAFRRVVEVNLVGTFNVLRLAAETMSHNPPRGGDGERGVIVTTASTAAYDGQIGQAAYSASKGGVAALTLPAARELGQRGIRVVCIAPGVFNTPMMRQLTSEQQQALVEPTPFPQRLGHPGEFAALVQHVLQNTMLNGAVLRLDGGLRMAAR